MKKNLIATLAVAAALPFALSACGNSSAAASSAVSEASKAAPQATTAAAQASAAASSAASKAATNSAVASATADTGAHTVVYKVTTNGKATVTYTNGTSPAKEDVTADWTKETQSKPGANVAALAVASSDVTNANAKVSCEILVDGVSKDKKSGEGVGANATCNATF